MLISIFHKAQTLVELQALMRYHIGHRIDLQNDRFSGLINEVFQVTRSISESPKLLAYGVVLDIDAVIQIPVGHEACKTRALQITS